MNLKTLKNIFFDILSFGSPGAIVFNLSLILLILAIIPFNYLIYSPVKCVFKHVIFPFIFGSCPTSGLFSECNCPACGLTRGMNRLLHGEFSLAWEYNPLVYLVFLIIVIMIIVNGIKVYKFYKKTGKFFDN